jgi:hypothetical protein
MARTVVSGHKVLLFVEAKRGFDDFAQSFPQGEEERKLSGITERKARIFIVKNTIVRLMYLHHLFLSVFICGYKTKKPQLSLRLVVWAGIEPATQGFSVLCSTD